MQKLLNKIANPLLKWLLRSRFHGLASRSLMLISVTGRKSSRRYTTPVNYARLGNTFTILSARERTWWRNLRGGAPVMICWQWRELAGRGEVLEVEPEVVAALTAYLRQLPAAARYLGVRITDQGMPEPEDVRRAAKGRVVVQVHLSSPGPEV